MTSTFIEVKLGLDKLLEENEFKLSLVVARSISLNLNILIPLHLWQANRNFNYFQIELCS